MSQHIERRQCGCVNDCFGQDIKTREEELDGKLPQQRACCEQCEDSEAPCVYEVLSACDHKIRYPDDDPGYSRIVMPKVLSLRKYCITGCEYRAGRGQGTSGTGLIPGEDFYFPIPADLVTSYGADFAEMRFPKLCTINERYWYPEELSSLVPQLLREDYDKLIDFSTTWILREIADSGGLWELVYVAPDNVALDISYSISSVAEGVLDELAVKLGRAIRYVSTEPWKCLEANNLEIDEETRTRYPSLPKFVCVRPKIDDVAHLCDTTESQCACCDNGMCTGYSQITLDCPAGPYQYPPFETKRYLPEERLDAVNSVFSPPDDPFAECLTGQPPVPAEIEELVPDVDTVPCGIFYGTFSGGGAVWWCTGTDYNMIIWCNDLETDEAVVVFNGTPTTFECRCDWYYFTINFETPPECLNCPGGGEPVVTECCEVATPRVLEVEVAANTDGGPFQPGCDACLGADALPAPISGTVVTVTYDDGTEQWEGEVEVCGVTLKAVVSCFDPGFANPFLLQLYVNGVYVNEARLGSGGTFTCDPFFGDTSAIAFSFAMSDCIELIATVSEAI